MSQRKKRSACSNHRSRKAKARAAAGKGSHNPARPQLLTPPEVAARLRRERSGIHAIFMLNDDGTLSGTVFLHDARNPMMSRHCHILDIEKLFKPPLDPQIANTIAQWRAEQGGMRGSA